MTWQVVDWTGAVSMALAGVLGIAAWAASNGEPRRVFWLLAGTGFVLLAVDELRSVHERVGRWLDGQGVPKPPGVNHMDDVVLLSYGVAGLVLCAVYWREVARPGVAAPFLLGFAALAVSIGIDALAPVEGAWPKVEEVIETGGTLLFLVGFWRRYAEVSLRRTSSARAAAPPGRATP
ncbi:MAG: hypothetical protein ACSLFM_13655 [Tepidiformaceae bacterium]